MIRTLTQDELAAELAARFGPDQLDWAFQCPQCEDVATARDFKAAGVDLGRVGQECIGRSVTGRGCKYAAYGLFPGPWSVTMPDGRTFSAFPIAPAPQEVQS